MDDEHEKKERQREVYDILRRDTIRQEIRRELEEWKSNQFREKGYFESISIDLNKHRSVVHQFVSVVIHSSLFEYILLCIIVLNSITLSLDTVMTDPAADRIFTCFDVAFTCIYLVEFLLKCYVSPTEYFRNQYNQFDFLVLTISVLQLVQVLARVKLFSNVSFLRIVRALRSLRALRSISFIHSLRVLVTALIRTMASIFNILIVLFLFMYIFAIVGTSLFLDPNADPTNDPVSQHWGNLGSALLVLWSYVTADGWAAFQYELDAHQLYNTRVYTVLFVFLGNFIFTNLFIAVIIQNLDAAQEEEKLIQSIKRAEVAAVKRQTLLISQARDFRNLKSITSTHPVLRHISEEKWMAGLAGRLQPDERVPTSDTFTDILWIDTFLTTLKHQERTRYRIQQLHFEMADSLADVFEDVHTCSLYPI
eukprot:TRINITY_DN8302_c0_g1_i1.p1 TRINITY_DN8302_c0_g1~~TRINITY_DN8302_c0_g1_i1.p1  ORF type:complete len:423 (-),score=32.71 TRINITY_DN8302_c0_g1_i1:59-1327(-)